MITLASATAAAQPTPAALTFLAQNPPGMSPEIFAPSCSARLAPVSPARFSHRSSAMSVASIPTVFIGVAVVLLFTGSMTCLLPAHHATKVDPVIASRAE